MCATSWIASSDQSSAQSGTLAALSFITAHWASTRAWWWAFPSAISDASSSFLPSSSSSASSPTSIAPLAVLTTWNCFPAMSRPNLRKSRRIAGSLSSIRCTKSWSCPPLAAMPRPHVTRALSHALIAFEPPSCANSFHTARRARSCFCSSTFVGSPPAGVLTSVGSSRVPPGSAETYPCSVTS